MFKTDPVFWAQWMDAFWSWRFWRSLYGSLSWYAAVFCLSFSRTGFKCLENNSTINSPSESDTLIIFKIFFSVSMNIDCFARTELFNISLGHQDWNVIYRWGYSTHFSNASKGGWSEVVLYFMMSHITKINQYSKFPHYGCG